MEPATVTQAGWSPLVPVQFSTRGPQPGQGPTRLARQAAHDLRHNKGNCHTSRRISEAPLRSSQIREKARPPAHASLSVGAG